MTTMTKQEMEAEMRRLAPFRHNLELPYGLRTGQVDAQGQMKAEVQEAQGLEAQGPEDENRRVQNLINHSFPPLLKLLGGSLEGMRVLDAASNAGGFSVEAARLGASHVLGFDVVDRYVEQANFVKTALGVENVEFKKLDLYELSEESVGMFDVTFCFGLLYHLEDPVGGMRKLASVTRRAMLVDTNTMPGDDNAPLWRMSTPSVASEENLEGSATNLWRDREYCQMKPNAAAVRRLLKVLGFDDVRRVKPRTEGLPPAYQEGRRRTFLAARTTPLP